MNVEGVEHGGERQIIANRVGQLYDMAFAE